MKVAVVGSRDIVDYNWISKVLDKYSIDEIISGGAKGVDSLAARYAIEHKIELTVFRPEWQAYGKSAGFIRNKLIVDHSEHVIAFWDGKSAGTKHSIEYAQKRNKLVEIYLSDNR